MKWHNQAGIQHAALPAIGLLAAYQCKSRQRRGCLATKALDCNPHSWLVECVHAAVCPQGDLHFTVPDGYRMVISQHPGGQLHQQLLPLDAQLPSWEWQYSADSSTGAVRLSYCSHLHSSQYSGMHVWEASSSSSRQQKPSQ